METTTLITVAALILSIVLHEVAHGFAANWLGDPTARLQGRLTANPLKHLDPFGSVILPALLALTSAPFFFGWAKPVPYNPHNLRSPWGLSQKWAEVIVAVAGPLTNILLAVIFALIVRVGNLYGLSASLVDFATVIVYINVLLAFFNLIPVPPLDGSKILTILLPYHAGVKYRELLGVFERYGIISIFLFMFFFVYVLAQPFQKLVFIIVSFLVG